MKKTRSKQPRGPEARTADLPALRDFARGYLHEDMLAEHGGAIGATASFVHDASAEEIHALALDLAALVSTARTWPIDTLEDYFRKTLRSAWVPRSLADVRALEAEISSSTPRARASRRRLP